MRSGWKSARRILSVMLPLLGLLWGCVSLPQSTPSLPDDVRVAGTPIVLTREARATQTAAAGGESGGFQARQGMAAATSTPAAPGGIPDATRDAVIESQLTRAPEMADLLTRLAETPVAEETPGMEEIPAAEGTPTPQANCSGGCDTYPTWCEPPVKGKLLPGERRIYYLPGDEEYAAVQVDANLGDVYFCTPEEAEAAGFQPPQ